MHLSAAILFSLGKVTLTICLTLVINSVLLSAIRVPKRLDTRRGRTYLAIVRSAISFVLFGIMLHIIFILLGINLTPLLASAGIVGIAIGMGARSLIEDLIAGFFLLTQINIAVGDYISVGGNIEGYIEDVGFRTLTIIGPTGALNIIQNGQVKQVINYSRGSAIVTIDIPIKGDQKYRSIKAALEQIIIDMQQDKKTNYHLSNESKVNGILAINAGNALVIRTTLYTTPPQRSTIDLVFREKVLEHFAKVGITLA